MRIVLVLMLTSPLTTATAAVKPGAVCKKPGQIQQVGATTFVCANIGSKSVWITTGSTATKKVVPKASPSSVKQSPTSKPSTVNNCTTGVGVRLQTQIVNDNYGLATLQIQNPLKCTVSYTMTGPLTCNHYKQMRTPISGMSSGTLSPNQLVRYYPQQAFQPAYQTCQQFQRAAGAGPEYGAGILVFAGSSYPAVITGVSN